MLISSLPCKGSVNSKSPPRTHTHETGLSFTIFMSSTLGSERTRPGSREKALGFRRPQTSEHQKVHKIARSVNTSRLQGWATLGELCPTLGVGLPTVC